MTARASSDRMADFDQRITTIVADHASAALVMVDARGACQYMNHAAERMTGYSVDEVLGSTLHEIFHRLRPDGSVYPIDECPLMRALTSTTSAAAVEEVFLRKDGTFFPVTCSLRAVTAPDGAKATVVEVRDLTEEKNAQQALRESEERYRLVSRAANDAIWDWNLLTNELLWNDGVEKVFGYSLAEVPPTLEWWSEHLAPEDHDRVVTGIREAIESGAEMWADEYRFVRKDGSYSTVLDRGLLARDANGKPLRMIGAMVDITDRKAAEERLKLHSRVLDSMSEGVVVSDRKGKILYTNPAHDRIFGYRAGELLGQNVTALNAYEPDENEEKVASAIAKLEADGVWLGEWRNRRKNGEEFTTSAHITALDIAGQPHWICVQRDITDEKKIEASLREGEQRYRSLVQATAAIVWHTTASGRLDGEQSGWSSFTGQTEAEHSGHGWAEAIHEEDRELTLESWNYAVREKTPFEIEHRVRRHDGEYRHMVARGVPILEADGSVREWVGLHTDITAERRLQQLLDAERLRLRDIFMRAPAAITVLRGPDHIFETANPLYLDLIGKRDILGKSVREAIPEATAQGFLDILNGVYASGEPFIGQEAPIILERNGEQDERFLDFVYQPMFDTDGSVNGIFVHVLDVTGQVRARRQMQEQAAAVERANAALQYQSHLNKTITDNAASCLFMMDEQGRPTFMNPAAEAVTGYTLDEIRDQPLHLAVHHHHPDGRPFPIEECPIDNGREQLIPLRDYRDVFVRKNGTFFPVACAVAPLHRDGQNLGAVLEFRDITDDLRAQEALKEADRRKDEFLATLSHELRTPLTVILGWARLLRMEGNDAETIGAALETIERSARMQAELIDDVLDLSRIVSGKIRIASDVIDVAGVATASLDGVRLAAAAKQIQLDSSLSGDKPLILGDAGRLQQIIWNLLTNAIKFTPVGGSVNVRVESGESHVRIEVRDSGIGISPEFLPHVFEAFRQAESATTRVHGGLGLGLSIVRHLVELHGGSISARSEGEGTGATFVVELPRLRQAEEQATAEEGAARGAASGSPLEALTGLSVLVIDDQDAVRGYVAAVVRRAGAEAEVAESVQDAIRAVQQHLPDVILCDIAMPQEDGYAFLKWMRSVPWPRHVPVIALTAFGRPEDRERMLEQGFDEYLRKPVDPLELTSTIAKQGKANR